ncbi:MAG TPA: serine/threonine-protein kinase, partial [Polyangiales bacterium]|nr:serine/threonine-protein kinase [Polyangiales bacterium]
ARGGFGIVYVAEQLATERRVALKLLSAHWHGDSIERLLSEARIAARLSSEHVVQVFDAGIDAESSLVFVAMELLSGTDLAELVLNQGPRSARDTVEYLRQVAIGLDKVHGLVASDGHAAPIVHRDLKPANLFLTRREDGSPWIKILDFGAAKVLSQNTLSSGALRGTPQYMAYEQASGGAVTPATDIWALGLIAFYLLTARSYWLGAQSESGQTQIFAEVLTLTLVPASQRARELEAPAPLSAAFDQWFFRCVNRDASKRFASAGEAARELGRALGVPISSVSPPVATSEVLSGHHSSLTPAAKVPTSDLAAVVQSARKPRVPRSRLLLAAALLAVVAVAAWLSGRVRPEPPLTTAPASAAAS